MKNCLPPSPSLPLLPRVGRHPDRHAVRAGMTCASCPITVKHALSKVEGVSKTDVSFDKRRRRHLRRCQDQRPEVDQGDRGRGLSVQPQTLIR